MSVTIEALAGFHALPNRGFMEMVGPLYARREAAGGIVFALPVEERHCNPMGICHGGMLTTFADMVIVVTAALATPGQALGPTVSLTCDFLAPAPLGRLVEGRGRSLRSTRSLGFAECLLTIAGDPVLRASGIMKLPPPGGGGSLAAILGAAPAA